MIPQHQIDEVIEKNDIVSVVSEYVRLSRKGANEWGLCPFHSEKTPSFSVNGSKQIFKCFGCGVGGNVIHFIMRAEGLDYVGAIQKLADRAGIELTSDGQGPDADTQKLKNDILALNKIAARHFFTNIKKSVKAQEYFIKRGITVDTLKKFGLGYAEDSWSDLLDACTGGALGVSPELMYQARLALKNDRGGYFDMFRNRVMFPIFDVNGSVIAFGGRVMDDSKPKYLNSPDTPAYSKGFHLYGLNFARKAGEKRVIIVEGYMDCIALHQKGITWAVASLGTALTQNQARLLKRYFEEVYIGYDSDGAGQNATIRGLDILAAQGLKVRVLNLAVVDANVKDPDEFLRKHTPEEFMKVVDNAMTLVSFKIKLLSQKFPPDRPSSRVDFLNGAASVIAKEPTASARTMYIKEVCETYKADELALSRDVETVREGGTLAGSEEKVQLKRVITQRGNEEQEQNAEPVRTKAEADLDRLEKRFIIFLAENPSYIVNYRTWREGHFTVPENAELFVKLLNRRAEGAKMGIEGLMSAVSPETASVLAQEAEWIKETTKVEELEKLVVSSGKTVRRQLLMKQLSETDDPEKQRLIMEQIKDLQK